MRPFPLDQVALRAEMLARCLPPERYYPMIETLFKTQEKWAVSQDWRPALERTARLAGVSSKDFDACLANKALEDEIVQSRLTARRSSTSTRPRRFLSTARNSRDRRRREALDELLSGLAKS